MISILIPTYNHRAFNLVEELNRQALSIDISYEILVLDDCSTNKLIIEENRNINNLENCSYTESKINNGRTFSRGILAKEAKYNWILFLDSDVKPKNDNFLKKYVTEIKDNNFEVVVGGCEYENKIPEKDKIFRYTYGKKREEKTAEFRSKIPHKNILSGNILIQKDIFLKYNYPYPNNIYGLDNYFTFLLFKNKVTIKHIDNPIYHLGLEDNEVFFNKSINSINSRINLLKNEPEINSFDSLIKNYNFFHKYKLNIIISFLFSLTEPFLKKKILSSKPSILAFDLYRLGYICKLK